MSDKAPFDREGRGTWVSVPPPTIGLTLGFLSPEGEAWAVRQVHEADGTSSLVFLGPGRARRVRHCPAGWYNCGAAQLWEISWWR